MQTMFAADDIRQRMMLNNLLRNIPASILDFFSNDYEVAYES